MDNVYRICYRYKIDMDINFEYYKIFYFAAKYGSITKAAAVLGSNQPNVTRVIRQLESQLGKRLFIREPRGIRLTGDGERLYIHAAAACEHLFKAQEELGDASPEGSGIIDIGATETALHLLLLSAMHDFRISYPDIRIRVHNHSTPDILKSFASGELDFAVVTSPFETAKAYRCENMHDFRDILVGGTQYRHLFSRRSPLKELLAYPWVGLGRGTATYDLYRDFFAAHGAELELDMEAATSDLLLPLIRHNFGIGFVPERLAQPLISKKILIQIPIDCETPLRSIKLLSENGHGKSRAADTFYRYLKCRERCGPPDA